MTPEEIVNRIELIAHIPERIKTLKDEIGKLEDRRQAMIDELADDISNGDPEMLTPEKAGLRLGVSGETVRKLCKSGQIEHRKVGKQYRIRPAVIDAFIDAGTQ